MIACAALVFGLLTSVFATTTSDESCRAPLSATHATIGIANFATHLDHFGIDRAHRLVIDAGSDNARQVRTAYEFNGHELLPVYLIKPEVRVDAQKAELDLRPVKSGPVELALKIWPKGVPIQDRHLHLEPLEIRNGEASTLNEINRELERGQLSAFKDAHYSLRVSLSAAFPPEAQAFAAADRQRNEVMMGRQQALKVAEQLGFTASLKQLRAEFDGAFIQLEDLEYRQSYSATSFYLVLIPTLRVPPELNVRDVHLAYYRILFEHLRKFSRETTPGRSRLNVLRERLQNQLQLVDPEDESIRFISINAQEFSIPSVVGPLKLVYSQRNTVQELDLTQGPNQE